MNGPKQSDYSADPRSAKCTNIRLLMLQLSHLDRKDCGYNTDDKPNFKRSNDYGEDVCWLSLATVAVELPGVAPSVPQCPPGQ